MSDYISIKDDRFWQILFDEACVEGKQAERIQNELEKIAVDEKEMIRKPFERVVERLEGVEKELTGNSESVGCTMGIINTTMRARKILKEECGINE